MASPTQTPWVLHAETFGGETRVTITGADIELDEAGAERVREELSGLVEDQGRCRLTLDLGNVRFLTSSMLGILLQLHKRLHVVGGHLIVANLRPDIYEIFTITNLTRVLDVRPHEEHAADPVG